MKKIVLCSILAIISGGILGKITFDRYDKLNIKPVIKLDENVYMLKYDTYKNKEDMINNTSNLEKYIYIEKDNKFYVYVAVAKTMDSINKLKNILILILSKNYIFMGKELVYEKQNQNFWKPWLWKG